MPPTKPEVGAKRWSRRKDQRPGEILEAALDCFAERGFAATRLDDVARRAGVTKGTLYLYFPNKEELFKAVVREALIPHIERIFAEVAGCETVEERLKRIMTYWAEHVMPARISAIPKLLIAEARNFPDLARFYLDEVINRVKPHITRILRKGIDDGELRDVDPDCLFFCLAGPMIFVTLWQQSFGLFDEQKLNAAGMLQTSLNIFFYGLKPRNETDQESRQNGTWRTGCRPFKGTDP